MQEGLPETNEQMGDGLSSAPLFFAAAHELKSPLALIRQLSLGIEAGDCTPEQLRTLSRQITLTSERALRLTTDLTKTARLQDGLFQLEPLNPRSLCQEVAAEISPLYHARGRCIRVSSRTRPLLALANRDLLRRILLGFADNALHYTSTDDPVTITVSMRSPEVIRLGVRDFGPAVPAKVWQRLTGTLGSHAQPLHSRPESSGLGIYIARQFAEAMGAQVGATRHRDGATFYVDIRASTQLSLL